MRRIAACFLMILAPVFAVAEAGDAAHMMPRPPARDGDLPRTRWEYRAEAKLWTRAALSALKVHGRALEEMIPRDIGDWCPAYGAAGVKGRRAFWVGFLSTLAKHESTYQADAVGGGGRWYGLLQILPSTARGYKCRATSGEALKNGAANLSCAIRIMAYTVPRDGVVSQDMRGVAADWGPLHSDAKRNDMQRWMRRQSYCRTLDSVRPRARPIGLADDPGQSGAGGGDLTTDPSAAENTQQPAKAVRPQGSG